MVEEYRTSFDSRPLKDQTLNSVLEDRADQLGDKRFISHGPTKQDFTYRETADIANSIGNSLLNLGVEKGDRICVLVRDPLTTVLSLFGISKCGAVYSPVNYEYKGEVLSYQINDIDPEVIVIEDRYLGKLNSITSSLNVHPDVVVCETDEKSEQLTCDVHQSTFDDLLSGSTDDPRSDVEWNDVASILYTSGTTGQPKGVVLTHRWILFNFSFPRHVILNQDDVVHTALPFYHATAAFFDLTGALVAGGQVAIWDKFDSEAFWDRIEKYEATCCTLLSVMIPWLNKQAEDDIARENTLNKMHMAPLPENHARIAREYGVDLITVALGSTESGVPIAGVIHAAKDGEGTPERRYKGARPKEVRRRATELGMAVTETVPDEEYGYVGKPLPHHEARVVDERGEEVDRGEVGEFIVRPDTPATIMREYFRKPEKTVESFQDLWYHSGDAASVDAEGNWYFVDRMGDLIRRRGENISSKQIEDIVGSQDEISNVAVFPVPAEEGGEDEIAIAVETSPGGEITETGLRDYLDTKLPGFMLPKFIFIVDEIPTTETNKVEKYKLIDLVE